MENEPTILNIQKRMQSLMLGINAVISLAQYCETLEEEEKSPEAMKDAVSELLSVMGLDDNVLMLRFLDEFNKSGMAGEA